MLAPCINQTEPRTQVCSAHVKYNKARKLVAAIIYILDASSVAN